MQQGTAGNRRAKGDQMNPATSIDIICSTLLICLMLIAILVATCVGATELEKIRKHLTNEAGDTALRETK
jgi:hypothetical protein